MEPDPNASTVSVPVVILALSNAALFAMGAMLHIGVVIGPIEEPVVVPVMVLEIVSTLFLGLATMGIFTAAGWARRLARFANTFAIIAVAAAAMLLALDGQPSSAPYKAMQVLRVVFAGVSLLMLYHSNNRTVAR